MKHTKEQIIEIAKKILKDIDSDYLKDKDFWTRYSEEQDDFIHTPITKGWTVGIDWFDEDYLIGNQVTAFLIIDDATGEPGTFTVRAGSAGVFTLKKKNNKYYKDKNLR